MDDPMTLSDERLKDMIRRADRGEITPEVWAAILNEHGVSRARMQRAGDEIDREWPGPRQFLRGFARDFGTPIACVYVACMASQVAVLAALIGCVVAHLRGGR